jgi:lysophospholipase L1-like esterase
MTHLRSARLLKLFASTSTLFVLFAGCAVAQGDPARAFDVATAAVRKPGTTVRIDLIGDSTQTDNAGYGRGFCANVTVQVDCLNMARGGASTRTYREMGLWDPALQTKPDYMIIQFGHNDEVTDQHLPRQVPLPDYKANLERFIAEARAAGITPVLCTPLARRFFGPDGKIHSDLTEYSDAMREVAGKLNVPLIDLQADSIAYLDRVGQAEADNLGITKKDALGKTIPDKTHLNWQGSYVFGRMVAVDLGRAVPKLKKYVRPTAAELPPAGVKAMQILNGAPVKIVLVGDSTVATGGGWGPGFCAVMTPNVTCIDDALNGRSTKSFIDEGAWKKALAERGDYYLIQFGHNDQKSDPARHTDAQGSFKDYLQRYIDDVRAIGAVPVLVTSLSRRTMRDGKIIEDLNDYAQATREVGAKNFITVIDLNRISTEMLNRMTQEQADQFDAVVHPDAKAENAGREQPKLDRTHLNAHGQQVFGRVVAEQLVRTQVELGPDLIGAPAASVQMTAQPTATAAPAN